MGYVEGKARQKSDFPGVLGASAVLQHVLLPYAQRAAHDTGVICIANVISIMPIETETRCPLVKEWPWVYHAWFLFFKYPFSFWTAIPYSTEIWRYYV